MNWKQRTIGLALVLIVILSGCSGNTNAPPETNEAVQPSETPQSSNEAVQEPTLPEEYTIQILTTQKPNVRFFDETEVGKVIKEKFNINFEFVPFTGDYREKLSLMLAAGDYPEILRVEGNDLVQQYIQAGVAIPLDDFLPDAAEFTKRYDHHIPYWIITDDKKLYKWEVNVPYGLARLAPLNDIAIRTDLLEQQGWPQLLSTDSYLEFLKEAKRLNPDSIGMVSNFGESWGMAGVAGIMYEKGGRYVAWANDAWVFNSITEQYEDFLENDYVRESYQFLNAMYNAGLLDEESFTDKTPQMRDKLSSGQALSMFYNRNAINAPNRDLIAAGKENMQYIIMPIRTNTQVARNEPRLLGVYDSDPFGSVIMTKNAKDPKRIFEFIDWVSSEEGQLLIQSGIEGVHYTVGADGKRVPTQAFIDDVQNPNESKTGIGLTAYFLPSSFAEDPNGQQYNLAFEPDVRGQLVYTDRQREAYEKLGWDNPFSGFRENVKLQSSGLVNSVTIDPSSSLGILQSRVVELRVRNSPKLIMAPNFDQAWDEVIAEHRKLEPQKIINELNTLYQMKKANP